MAISKIDSNTTGLSYAEEDPTAVKTLPTTPVWYPLEPNGYNDMGGKIKTVAREPIKASRQKQKGTTVDVDSAASFGHDLTQNNMIRILQGFMFADIRQHPTTAPMNSVATALTSVTASTKTYTAASGLSTFLANHLVRASNFSLAGNNGLKSVASSTSTTVVVNETLADEASPPATGKLEVCGFQFPVGTLSVDVSGTWPKLNRASGAIDYTTLGLIPGEWIFVGGDGTGLQFATAACNGFARVRSVAVGYIELDKASGTLVTDAGTGKTIQIFFGNVLKNESNTSLIKRRTYQIERTLGLDANGTMSEYVTGAVPNELHIQIRQADKITTELAFVGMDTEQRTGAQGVKAGTRTALVSEAAFNTSSDFSRIKMHIISTTGNVNPTPIVGYLTELTINLKNNISPLKAVGVLGAFEASAGMFDIGGSTSAYFSDVAAVSSVRSNADVSMDAAIVKNNAGIIFDIPLITLGDARLKVEKDKPIMIPLEIMAAEGSNGHTFMIGHFPYLPTLADS